MPFTQSDEPKQEECPHLHRRDGKRKDEDDEDEDAGTDNLELLTVLLVWSLLLFGLFQVMLAA